MSKDQTEWVIKDTNEPGRFHLQQDAVVSVLWGGDIQVALEDGSHVIIFNFDEATELRKALKQALKAAAEQGVV